MFNEATIEQMLLNVLQSNGWEYIPTDRIDRRYNEVMEESLESLCRIRIIS